MFKKWVAGMAMVGSMMCAAQALAAYPERNIQAVIPWGAGGATDSIARGLTPLVEKALDTRLVLTNRPGGTGLIGTNYVMQQRADGYTMLYGAENPQLYQLLGIADFDYDALHPINIIGQNRAVIAVPPDSPFKTMRELVDHAKAHPGELRMGVVGAGGLPSTVFAMIDAVEDLDVREVTFGGDGPGITALLGGHIDFMPLSLAPTRPQIQSGRLRALAVFDKEEVAELPGVAPITDALPDMAPYLPWGSFWGVFVRKDVPEEVKQSLEVAYKQAVASPEFQQFLVNYGAGSLNLSGQEAEAFLKRWQSVTAWSIYRAGGAKTAPTELGIPQP
ncbi:MAG: tricarboxylate transport protein TctC [Pseudomonas sp.]|jgi:tripartite-type tricarboxylate transporter receptor subunit TctC|nr:tricarboxylate transport protein TctC [Pseudomonadales bacterium]MAK86847.1 tricarboxylate transport protein TctC [Pseudomonas sp.]|tara:strand:+ start:5237 stop:6235 length:999 start_codon:yes stop_codon:yes gene_type:complete